MIYNKPISKCSCGKLPKLSRQKVDGTGTTLFYRYSCKSCNTNTFGTREEICARELWNSTIERKIKK